MARICPKCGSRNVEPDTSAATMQTNPGKWSCNNCSYSGPMPEE